jgi:hypothetical protein
VFGMAGQEALKGGASGLSALTVGAFAGLSPSALVIAAAGAAMTGLGLALPSAIEHARARNAAKGNAVYYLWEAQSALSQRV